LSAFLVDPVAARLYPIGNVFVSFVPGLGPGIREQPHHPISVSWMARAKPAMNGDNH
jgi:hypothetical protein